MFYNSCYINVMLCRLNRVFSKTHGICASKIISKIMGQQSLITSIEVPHALESGCRIYANAWHYDGNDPCPLVISLHWTESSRGWWDSGTAECKQHFHPICPEGNTSHARLIKVIEYGWWKESSSIYQYTVTSTLSESLARKGPFAAILH